MTDSQALVEAGRIEQSILVIRGWRVMLDADLASFYGVDTRTLVQAVRRKQERFPSDFIFQLTDEEFADLRSQSVISRGWGGRRYAPYAFTEQGVAMLSSVLNSPRAIQVNVEIMRAFVRLRTVLATNAELARRLDELERKYDRQFEVVIEAIRKLMAAPNVTPRRIGFQTGNRRQEE